MADSLFSLAGRVALVTGSSRGIGRAIAIRMAQQGADVIVSSRKPAACEAAAAEIEAMRQPGWGRVTAIAANVSSAADIDTLARTAQERFGRVDTLVCNAAANVYVGPTEGLTEAAMRKVIETNMMGLYWLVQAFTPGMRERGEGRIIFVSSITAHLGMGESLSYAMTKAAGEQAMRTLAVELGPHGIRCNTVCPGTTRTDMSRGMYEQPGLLNDYQQRSPVRAIAEPDHMAGVAVFLASPAAAHVNGQTIVVDGGYCIG